MILLPSPSQPVLQRGHPLARGLVFCVLPQLRPVDLVSGNKLGAKVGDSNWGVPMPGVRSVRANTGSGSGSDTAGFYWPFSDVFKTITTHFTSVWYGIAEANLAWAKHISFPYRSSGWSQPYGVLIAPARIDNTTTEEMHWAWNSSTGFESPDSASGMYEQSAKVPLFIGCTRAVTAFRIFKNGKIFSTATGGSSNSLDWSGGREPVCLLTRSSTSIGEGLKGNVGFAAVWNRALPDSAINNLYVLAKSLCGRMI